MLGGYLTSFIKGRSILESIAITRESKHTKYHRYLLKLDFEKAYDTVNWEWLLERLKPRDFGERWIRWIHSWLISAKIQVLLDGKRG